VLGSLFTIAARLRQRTTNRGLFRFFHRWSLRDGRCRRLVTTPMKDTHDVFDRKPRRFSKNRRSFERIAQFADIARKVSGNDGSTCTLIERQTRPP
jgi:hypothetical protein